MINHNKIAKVLGATFLLSISCLGLASCRKSNDFFYYNERYIMDDNERVWFIFKDTMVMETYSDKKLAVSQDYYIDIDQNDTRASIIGSRFGLSAQFYKGDKTICYVSAHRAFLEE